MTIPTILVKLITMVVAVATPIVILLDADSNRSTGYNDYNDDYGSEVAIVMSQIVLSTIGMMAMEVNLVNLAVLMGYDGYGDRNGGYNDSSRRPVNNDSYAPRREPARYPPRNSRDNPRDNYPPQDRYNRSQRTP